MHKLTSGHTDRQLWVLFGVVDRIQQSGTVQYVHIQVLRSMVKVPGRRDTRTHHALRTQPRGHDTQAKDSCGHNRIVPVNNALEILDTSSGGFAQGGGNKRKRVADAVHARIIRNLGHRVQRRQGAGRVTPMHRVGSGGERFPGFATVGCGASLVPVHNIGGDGEDAHSVHRVAVGLVLAKLLDETAGYINDDFVHTVVIVAKLWEVSLNLEALRDAGIRIAHSLHTGILDGGQTVRDDRKSGNAERHVALHLGVV